MDPEPSPGMLAADQQACASARRALLDAAVPAERLLCPHVIERDWLWGRRVLFRAVRTESPRNAVVNVWRFFGRVWIDWTPDESFLFDPQEEEPGLAAQFLEADVLVEAAMGWSRARGTCHYAWSLKEKILRERFGIRWKSPREMNPDVLFD